MSSFELNKIVGAILSVALVAMVIGFIGDALVNPGKHQSAQLKIAKAVTIEPKEEEKLEPIGPLLAAASVEKGKAEAKKCTACHDLTKAKKNKIGPPLWGILMSKPATMDGFKYSSAMEKMGGTWGYEELNAFLANPKGYVKGTKMSFGGIKKATDRAELIAFLRTLSDSPAPLP